LIGGTIFLLFLFRKMYGGGGPMFYLRFFSISFIITLTFIGILVGFHAFFTKRMEPSEAPKNYSLDSTEESGKRQKGSTKKYSD